MRNKKKKKLMTSEHLCILEIDDYSILKKTKLNGLSTSYLIFYTTQGKNPSPKRVQKRKEKFQKKKNVKLMK